MAKMEKWSSSELIHKMTFNRCVDDIICISDSTVDADDIQRDFSQSDEKTESALEMGRLDGLPFLDLLLSRRQDGSIQHPFHHEKTWTG